MLLRKLKTKLELRKVTYTKYIRKQKTVATVQISDQVISSIVITIKFLKYSRICLPKIGSIYTTYFEFSDMIITRAFLNIVRRGVDVLLESSEAK
jgi:hypothetical protein